MPLYVPSGIPFIGELFYISAGEDQIKVCDPDATLTAIVIGDLRGHVTLWEQIIGVPVSFTGPVKNVLTVSYTAITFEDKKFRFWIDKGTSREQYADVNVFGTPTHRITTGGAAASITVSDYSSSYQCRTLSLSNFKLNAVFPLELQEETASNYCNQTANYIATWRIICDESRVVQFILQTRSPIETTWTDLVTLPATARNAPITLPLGYAVRLLVAYKDVSQITYYPSIVGYTNPEPDNEAVDSIEIGATGSSLNAPVVFSYDVLVRTLVGYQTTFDDLTFSSPSSTTNHVQVTSYDVLTRTLLGYQATFDDLTFSSPSSTTNHVVMLSYNVLDLGGGQVGG